MNNTALGAEKAREIIFISDAHEKFYYEKLKEVRYQDECHKALCYCLGICNDTRKNVRRIYDFKTGNVKTECLREGWQTSGNVNVVRLAFNLYGNGMPSVSDYEDAEEQIGECGEYTVEELFCCAYAPYFWQAVQIRYPDYAIYDWELHAAFWRTGLMLKVRLMGTKNDIRWFGKLLRRHPKIEVTEFSDMYPNKGTKKYYRTYAEVKKSNTAKK